MPLPPFTPGGPVWLRRAGVSEMHQETNLVTSILLRFTTRWSGG